MFMNSDVVNDHNHVYFLLPDGLAKVQCVKDLKEVIADGKRKLEEKGYMPKYVFIPFVKYHEAVAAEDAGELLPLSLYITVALGLQFMVLVPDFLKDRITLKDRL